MSIYQRTFWLVIFSMAMGYLEASVVVYLRELYYPNGFAFPLIVLSQKIGTVEILREAATVVMLVGLAMLAGNNKRQRLAFFLIAFAVWDIFYYVFLKLTLDWPSSLLTWDILFLIPAPWVGPVISPLIACLTMLFLAGAILRNEQKGITVGLTFLHWVFMLGGSLLVVAAWMWDYLTLGGNLVGSADEVLKVLSGHVPVQFNWWLFAAGELVIVAGIALYAGNGKKDSPNSRGSRL